MSNTSGEDAGLVLPWASSPGDVQILAPNRATDAKKSKKRRVQRACDSCRRKKIKCDAAQALSPGEMCRNCVASGAKCTFFNESTTHGQSKAYVSALEQKLESMEELLRKLSLRVDIEAELAQHMSDSPPERPIMATVLRSAGTIDLGPLKTRGREDLSSCFGRDYEVEFESSGSDDDDGLPERITKTLQEFNMTESPTLFHGKSSGFRLLRAATLLKKEQGIQPSPNPTPQPQMSSEWERRLMEAPPPSEFTFPPDGLIRVLFDLFFLHFTPFLPVLHQPTFEAQYRSGLHLKNTSFAKSVLLVCAIASRYCDDSRVCFEEIGRQSAGWRYFIQVGDLKRPAYVSATLNDIQCYVMLAYFLQTTCAHNAAWTVVGNGIRAAQDIGMHRRRAGKGPISLYDEQQKRAFWCLVTIDAYMSAILGRPMAYHDEDFDLDLPVEVDDEYWPLPNQDGSIATPTQPDGLPSKISFFVTYVKLNQIIGFMLRTIYSFNKNKALLGFGGEKWDQLVVSELDSRMNKLLDSVPEHLKWDANRQNDVHFMQSSMLYASCYMWQIFIHRPFIHSIKGPSTLSFPSMSICTNAARSCSHVLEAVQNRNMRAPAPLLGAAINSGIVLLMALWSASKTGVSIDCQATMRDVNQCISFLKACNEDWQTARLLVEILEDLATCEVDGDHSHALIPPSLKRNHSQFQEESLAVSSSGLHSTRGDDSSFQDVGSNSQPTRAPDSLLRLPNTPLHHSSNTNGPISFTQPTPSGPVAYPPMSPTSQFLQSYLGTLPFAAGLTQTPALDPTLSNGYSTVGISVPNGPMAASTNSAAVPLINPNPIATGGLNWEDLLRIGPQPSASEVASNRFGGGINLGDGVPSTFELVDPYVGYQGFGGSLGFAVEAQAFLGSGGSWSTDTFDWRSLLHLGPNIEQGGTSGGDAGHL